MDLGESRVGWRGQRRGTRCSLQDVGLVDRQSSHKPLISSCSTKQGIHGGSNIKPPSPSQPSRAPQGPSRSPALERSSRRSHSDSPSTAAHPFSSPITAARTRALTFMRRKPNQAGAQRVAGVSALVKLGATRWPERPELMMSNIWVPTQVGVRVGLKLRNWHQRGARLRWRGQTIGYRCRRGRRLVACRPSWGR